MPKEKEKEKEKMGKEKNSKGSPKHWRKKKEKFGLDVHKMNGKEDKCYKLKVNLPNCKDSTEFVRIVKNGILFEDPHLTGFIKLDDMGENKGMRINIDFYRIKKEEEEEEEKCNDMECNHCTECGDCMGNSGSQLCGHGMCHTTGNDYKIMNF